MNWVHLKAAVKTVQEGGASRVDGDGFRVYKVSDGTTRIDILPKKEKQ
jgi:hypothetical protein